MKKTASVQTEVVSSDQLGVEYIREAIQFASYLSHFFKTLICSRYAAERVERFSILRHLLSKFSASRIVSKREREGGLR